MDSTFGTAPLKEPLSGAELEALNSQHNGLSHTLGIEITFVASDRVEGYVEVEPRHHQVSGIANGGIYATIGETLGSVAAIAASGKAAVGMSNNTDLLGSVSEGRIDGVATPVHTGRSTHLWRVEMHHGDKLVAVTNLKLMILQDRD